MSKIGKKEIIIPEGIKIEIKDGKIRFQNTKNEFLDIKILEGVSPLIQNNVLSFGVENKKNRRNRMNWGTMRALANNAVVGLSQGFSKILEIEGIGYRAVLEEKDLILSIGFSHPVHFALPAGIKAEINKNIIKISGFDKDLVGKTAAEIRNLKKPEPYKGKGIRYQGEVIRRKMGKKVEAAGAAK